MNQLSLSGPVTPTRVLYMEDEPGLARLVQKRLQRLGYEVVIAPDGTQGLHLLDREVFDIVMIDYNMPHRNGLEVLTAMKGKGEMPPTLMLSAMDILDVAVTAMKLGASDYLLKHADTEYLELLPSVLERILEKQRLQFTIRKNQQELSERTQILQATLDNIAQGLCVVDRQLRLTCWNQKFIELLNYDDQLIHLGTSLDELFQRDKKSSQPSPLEAWLSSSSSGKGITSDFCCEWVLADERVLEISANAMPDGGFVATYTDITESKRRERKIWHMANFDQLTDLPNRHLFFNRLDRELFRTKRSHQRLALAYIDLDGFKPINDRLGHGQGDVLLTKVTQRITKVVRTHDTVARLGGDEFAVLLPSVDSRADIDTIFDRMLREIQRPFDLVNGELEPLTVSISASIGIALFPEDSLELDTLVNMADSAMYKVKNEGKDGWKYYQDEI